MVQAQRIRYGGLAAMLGAALGIVVTPVLTFAGWMAGPANAPPTMAWARAIRPAIMSLVTFGSPEDVLRFWGGMVLPIYLLFLGGLLGLHARLCGGADRLERRGFQIARVGLAMNVVGIMFDYWLGPEILGKVVWAAGFTVGTLIGSLVYTLGAILLGRSILHTAALPRWTGWALSLAPFLGIALGFWGVHYIPANFVLGNSVGWLLLGYALWADKGSQPLPLAAHNVNVHRSP